MKRLSALIFIVSAVFASGCSSKSKKSEAPVVSPDANTAVKELPESTEPKKEETTQNLDQLTNSILQEAQNAVDTTKKEPLAEVPTPTPVENKSMSKNLDKYYFVQVASYGRKQDAIRLAETLKAGRVEPLIDVAELDGKTWHRVILGAFETRKEAEDYLASEKLKEKFSDAFVRKSKKSDLNLFKVE